MLGYWMLGVIASWQGDFERARRELERAVALYDPNEQKAKTLASQIDPGVNALCHLSWVLWTLGWPDRAIRTSDEAVRTARKLAQPFALAMTLFFACETRACCGQHASASVLLDELLALTAEHGFGYLASCARILKGQELIARDDCAAGLVQVERALSEFAAQEGGLGLPWSMSISAWGYARLGRVDEGLAALARGFEAMPRNDERHWEAELWRLKGELLLLRPEPDSGAARACFHHAIEVARRQAALSLELRAATSLARLLDRQGDSAFARTMLAQLVSRFTEGAGSADLVAATEVLEQIGRLQRE
jgi:tetratricopeptide (TPR) repeat protein